jgi:hypothetical protein
MNSRAAGGNSTNTSVNSLQTVARRHLIGLLLATEEDWPTAFETLLRRLRPIQWRSETHEFVTERVVHEPFDLRYKPRYQLIIDRLAWWYDVPREWLKKLALMDEVYLLNNPFTFQAMEKHSAYCALMRLGIKVPRWPSATAPSSTSTSWRSRWAIRCT